MGGNGLRMPWTPAHHIRHACEASLRRPQTDHIDVTALDRGFHVAPHCNPE
jgi:aryl-alcohol dehydrogenase-like predicted oxidoreductase